jgi:hypothetical protein
VHAYEIRLRKDHRGVDHPRSRLFALQGPEVKRSPNSTPFIEIVSNDFPNPGTKFQEGLGSFLKIGRWTTKQPI